jgi:bla regulator protein blaR1
VQISGVATNGLQGPAHHSVSSLTNRMPSASSYYSSMLVKLAILAAGAAVSLAQTPAPAAAQLQFEVASVKPNTSMSGNSGLNRGPGGTMTATDVSLRFLVAFAYDVRDYQLAGGPSWMDKDKYDIVARLDHDAAAAEAKPTAENAVNLRLRLRALLADRFQLVVHSETREMPIAVLVAAKNGPHLEESKSDGTQIMGQVGLLTCKKVSMKMFAERVLSQRLGRSVLDKTGIAGDFDFKVQYVEEAQAKSGGDAPTAGDAAGPTFLTAMQEQLGLKLESQKGPVEFIIVDHAEKASAN